MQDETELKKDELSDDELDSVDGGENVTKNMTIAEAMRANPKAQEVLLQLGVKLSPAIYVETLEQCAAIHGADLNMLISIINNK